MHKIPIALIYTRLLIGFIILALGILHVANYAVITVVLFSLGLLSDVFDGIIARRLNISTQKLRRLDSVIDQIFWALIVISLYIQCPSFFHENYIQLSILIGVEVLAYIICFIKFKKEVATHAISSKIWTLLLFATVIEIMVSCNSTVLFQICFYTGILTRAEIIAIILLLRNWTNDVPSIYHAVLLRKGKPIKRHKLFNG